ncbi:DNA-directed DNA polymerase gamma mip1 [Ceratocystis pirilliformis]|uniref:DNA-directed DNA polymerase n=1 Tax=Ceratocystis pirilliformis TaxID=259994 RepID=A0ABR3YPM8_9PEZI
MSIFSRNLIAHRAPLRISPPSNLRIVSRRLPAFTAILRCASTKAATEKEIKTLALPATTRTNEIGIQHISHEMHKQIFPNGPATKVPQELVELAKLHLTKHNLLGKNTDENGPIAFEVPELVGKSKTLDEHFTRLGIDCAEPYLTKAKEFSICGYPRKPSKWVQVSGWVKYTRDEDGREVHQVVDAPDDDCLCFDTEVLWKESPYAIIACAMSPTHWYSWLSPWLLGESDSPKHLVPLGDPSKKRIIVGHNVGYDRARILEEYDKKQTNNAFIDTMSLHVAVNGMCTQQRPTWMRHRKNRELRERMLENPEDVELAELIKSRTQEEEEELWVERSSVNSLRDVAQFHLKLTMDKSVRDDFGTLNRQGVVEKLQELMDYCAADVQITHKIYRIIFPNFLEVCPHPVSFAALRHLSSVILPVDQSWQNYIQTAENTYQAMNEGVQKRLIELAHKALEAKDNSEVWSKDPWLCQLDWSGQEIRMAKGKKKNDPPRPAANQKMPGMPKWFKDLYLKASGPINLTVRTRISPILLHLCWDGHPLIWSDKYGWTFRVTKKEANTYLAKQMVLCDFSEGEKVQALIDDKTGCYFKLPHKDGPNSRCTNPMAKSYLPYFEKGILSSEYPYAKEALNMNASCSYWISARDRIMSQMVVYEKDFKGEKADGEQGYIIPQIIPMGTITRRAVENTWLTASNAKKNRVGSELKAMVKAPQGYSFVGADVDSEELWIASLVGDATFKLHGGNAIGFMTLEGTKASGTDMHSRTASILGITRNDAKVFNYGRIYGAGLKFAATLLRQFNPNISEQETMDTASRLYANTKGTKTNRKVLHKRPFWRGGTESFVFNKLEEFAEQERPRTFVLGAGITEALMGRFISKGGYLTSRINWAIQSSGVDYLHLLIVAMDYLIRRYSINARLSITVHDEIRYLVKNEDRYRAAMALQVANLWTRAMFSEQVGIPDLPQSVAFFSAVDIDHVLRKEVDIDCITPSHKTPIPHGESVDIETLLAKGKLAYLDPNITPDPLVAPKPENTAFSPRSSVMAGMKGAGSYDEHVTFLKAQIIDSDKELEDLVKQRVKKRSVASALAKSATSTSGGSGSKSRDAATVPSNASDSTGIRTQDGSKGSAYATTGIKPGPGRPVSLKNVIPYHATPKMMPTKNPIVFYNSVNSFNYRSNKFANKPGSSPSARSDTPKFIPFYDGFRG